LMAPQAERPRLSATAVRMVRSFKANGIGSSPLTAARGAPAPHGRVSLAVR
jgi:hypothetical protein